MRRYWIAALMALMMSAAGLMIRAGAPANAQEAASKTQLAVMLDGSLARSVPDKPALQLVTHERCGVSLGGRCPGGVRSCIRSGRPKAECEAWGERCDACNTAMAECRRQVGHVAGATCRPCLAAFTKCRAALQVPEK